MTAGNSQLWMHAVYPQSDGGPWDHLLRKLDETVELALQAQTDVVVHRPQVREESPLQAQSVVALEIHAHVLRGGRLGWLWLPWRLHWKKALSIWTVHGRPPKTADQIAAILRLLSVKIARNELQVLWDGLMAAHGVAGFHGARRGTRACRQPVRVDDP